MSRLTFLTAGAIGLALLSATPAGAATSPPPPVGATTVTSYPWTNTPVTLDVPFAC